MLICQVYNYPNKCHIMPVRKIVMSDGVSVNCELLRLLMRRSSVVEIVDSRHGLQQGCRLIFSQEESNTVPIEHQVLCSHPV